MPVVVKPSDGNHGRGVFIELTSREEVESAYGVALAEGSGVLVERYIPGTEHRLLIVGNRLVAASRGDSVSVTGNGNSTIRELIRDQINSDPRRGATEDHPLNLVGMDVGQQSWKLARQGFARIRYLQPGWKFSFSATVIMHLMLPTKYIRVLRRRRRLRRASWGSILPGLISWHGHFAAACRAGRGHCRSKCGSQPVDAYQTRRRRPRPVGEAIVDHLFPDHDDGRIPVVGITGSYGKTTVAHIVARLLTLSGKHTGLACSDGFYLDRQASLQR